MRRIAWTTQDIQKRSVKQGDPEVPTHARHQDYRPREEEDRPEHKHNLTRHPCESPIRFTGITVTLSSVIRTSQSC